METKKTEAKEQPVLKIEYRDGELENLLRVREHFIALMESYADETYTKHRGKLLGSTFDTVFFIGISNLREHTPCVKEVYLNVGESRNRSLRDLELLEKWNIVKRVTDDNDSRVKRLCLTDKFRIDFESFIEQWVDSRTHYESAV